MKWRAFVRSPLDNATRELLFRMTVAIKNVRPPIISEQLAADLNDFLQFRHLFRNIYGFELKSDLLDRLVEKFDRTATRFVEEIKNFLKEFKLQ